MATNPLAAAARSAVSRRTWRARKREGGQHTDALTGEPIYAGGMKREGKWYHKLSYYTLQLAQKAGAKGEEAERVAKGLLGKGGRNPRPAPGKSTRPPAKWMAHIRPHVMQQYPTLGDIKFAPCSEQKTHAKAVDCVVSGIWHGYDDATQDRLIKKYEGTARKENPVTTRADGRELDSPPAPRVRLTGGGALVERNPDWPYYRDLSGFYGGTANPVVDMVPRNPPPIQELPSKLAALHNEISERGPAHIDYGGKKYSYYGVALPARASYIGRVFKEQGHKVHLESVKQGGKIIGFLIWTTWGVSTNPGDWPIDPASLDVSYLDRSGFFTPGRRTQVAGVEGAVEGAVCPGCGGMFRNPSTGPGECEGCGTLVTIKNA